MCKYSYSTDEEHFTGQYGSLEEAAEEGFNDNPDCTYLWVGENHKMTAHAFICPQDILDAIAESAADECGESSADWLDKTSNSKEKREEFKNLIGDWLEANDPVTFWTVDNVTLVNITLVDLAPRRDV